MANKNYTLKDIAKLAKVSRGTVDRVIHKRGRVSDHAREKVEQVLNAIDYQPNLIAKSLKKHKNHLIGAIIPKDDEGEYWQQCAQGVQRAEIELRQFGISLMYFRYTSTQTDFEQQLSKAISKDLDALLMVPIYPGPLEHLFLELQQSEIPVAFLNLAMPGFGKAIFLGQANKKSGRLAGQLMDNLINDQGKGKMMIMHLGIKSGHSQHLLEKENGFKEYFAEKYAQTSIEVISSINISDIYDLEALLSDLTGIFVTTSKIHELNAHLKNHPHIKTIGYDLIPANIESLKNGTVDILLNQNPELQGYNGITSLSDFLLYTKDLPDRKLFPVDIVVKENADDFI